MDIMQAVKERHSVRKYLAKPIESEKIEILQKAIKESNEQSGLNIQLLVNEPEAFTGPMAHYGSFENCSNYFALVGKKSRDEDIGYFGEELVLLAQQLGLNTCWVYITYSKGKVKVNIENGEKLYIVIALGYGATQGHERKTKTIEELCKVSGEMPAWFESAMHCAQLAPTAVNQQKFLFTLQGNCVKAKSFFGPCHKIDLGIVKYHFELGANGHEFEWSK